MKIQLSLKKILRNAVITIVTKSIFLKLTYNIQESYLNFIMITIFTRKSEQMKIQKVDEIVVNLIKRICYLNKKFKTSIKSLISFEKRL